MINTSSRPIFPRLSIVIKKKSSWIKPKITADIEDIISNISLYKKKLVCTKSIIRIVFINSRFAFSRCSGECPESKNLNPTIRRSMP